MQTHAFTFISIMLFMQCASRKAAPLPPDAPFVTLATSGCRGYCPVFTLALKQNAYVEYTPDRYCAVAEKRTFRLTQAEYDLLKTQVAAIPYKKYPAYIESTIADAPAATLTFHERDTAYSITGTIDRPKSLIELENTIRDIAAAHGIDTRKAFDPNETPPASASELLVQLKEEINAGNWITQIQVGNPRLVRRIPPNNAWVVSFDHTQIGVKEMIAVIEGSVDVVRVARNMRSSERKEK
jgi:Domain of unknown function (DUF6438)